MNDTPFTRRTLIKAGAAAGATLLLPIDLAVAGPSGDPAYLERSSYAGLTGSGFTARGTEQSVPLTLDAIGDLGDATPGAEDAFSLRFSAFGNDIAGPRASARSATRRWARSTCSSHRLPSRTRARATR